MFESPSTRIIVALIGALVLATVLVWIIVAPGFSIRVSVAEPVNTPEKLFRVCADPNNLPFSNDRQEGFENKSRASSCRCC